MNTAMRDLTRRSVHPGADCDTADERDDRPSLHGPAATVGPVAAMAVLVAATIVAELGSRTPSALLVLDVVMGVAGCLALPVVLRRPLAGALGFAALAVLSPSMTPLAGASLMWLAQRAPLPMAVGVAGAGVAAQVLRGLWRPVGLPLGWWFALFAAVFAAIVGWGAMAQARRAVIASLRERARRAEADQARRIAEARRAERTRIAREMHDVLAHRLSLLATYAGALEYRPDAPPVQLARAAEVIRNGAHQALDELREVIGLLRDDTAAAFDGQRPQPTLSDLPRLVQESRDAGMRVDVDDRIDDPSAVPDAVGRTVYRIVQEGLTNARRHAGGQPVRLVVHGSAGAELIVDVRNPLPGDSPTGPDDAVGGSGLIGLRERIRLAGGHLEHDVTAGGEFRLRATLPWPA
jgi:signal transduction histidine kinase